MYRNTKKQHLYRRSFLFGLFIPIIVLAVIGTIYFCITIERSSNNDQVLDVTLEEEFSVLDLYDAESTEDEVMVEQPMESPITTFEIAYDVEEELISSTVKEEDSGTVTEEDGSRMITSIIDNLNIREEPDINSNIVGILSDGNYATILQEQDDWFEIQSGDLTGWVNAEYVVTDLEAMEIILCSAATAISNTDNLNVHTEPDIESDILCSIDEGEGLPVIGENIDSDKWVAVLCYDQIAYVYAEYVDIIAEYTYAQPVEVYEEVKETKTYSSTIIINDVTDAVDEGYVSVTYDDQILLAALIYCEAGAGNGDAQVAVGAVVMNRVRSSIFPNSISEVIYQTGQFEPVSNGKFATALGDGSYMSCMNAAQSAINGADPTNGCKFFLSASVYDHEGLNLGGNIFFSEW